MSNIGPIQFLNSIDERLKEIFPLVGCSNISGLRYELDFRKNEYHEDKAVKWYELVTKDYYKSYSSKREYTLKVSVFLDDKFSVKSVLIDIISHKEKMPRNEVSRLTKKLWGCGFPVDVDSKLSPNPSQEELYEKINN